VEHCTQLRHSVRFQSIILYLAFASWWLRCPLPTSLSTHATMARPKKLPGALKELITKLAATNSLKKKLPSTKDVQSALRNAIKAINETDSIPSEEVLAAFETIAEAFPRIPTIVSHDQGSAKRKGTSGGGPDLERALSMLHLEFVGHVIARVTALALVPEDDEGNEELEKDKEKGMVQVLTKAYQIVQNAVEDELIDREHAGKACLSLITRPFGIRDKVISADVHLAACEAVRSLLSGCKENKERVVKENVLDVLCPSKKLPAIDRRRFAERAFGALCTDGVNNFTTMFLGLTASNFDTEARTFLNAFNAANDGVSQWYDPAPQLRNDTSFDPSFLLIILIPIATSRPVSVPATHLAYNANPLSLPKVTGALWVDFNKRSVSFAMGPEIGGAGSGKQEEEGEEDMVIAVSYTKMAWWEWAGGGDGDEMAGSTNGAREFVCWICWRGVCGRKVAETGSEVVSLTDNDVCHPASPLTTDPTVASTNLTIKIHLFRPILLGSRDPPEGTGANVLAITVAVDEAKTRFGDVNGVKNVIVRIFASRRVVSAYFVGQLGLLMLSIVDSEIFWFVALVSNIGSMLRTDFTFQKHKHVKVSVSNTVCQSIVHKPNHHQPAYTRTTGSFTSQTELDTNTAISPPPPPPPPTIAELVDVATTKFNASDPSTIVPAHVTLADMNMANDKGAEGPTPPTPWMTKLRRNLEQERSTHVDEIINTVLVSASATDIDYEDAGEEYVQWPSENVSPDVSSVEVDRLDERGRRMVLDGENNDDVWEECHMVDQKVAKSQATYKKKGKGRAMFAKELQSPSLVQPDKEKAKITSAVDKPAKSAPKAKATPLPTRKKPAKAPSEDTVIVAEAIDRENELSRFWSGRETVNSDGKGVKIAKRKGKRGARADDDDAEFLPRRGGRAFVVKERKGGGSMSVALNGSPRPIKTLRGADGRKVRVVVPSGDSENETVPVTTRNVPNDVYYHRNRRMGRAYKELLQEGRESYHTTADKIRQIQKLAFRLRNDEDHDEDDGSESSAGIVRETRRLKIGKGENICKTDQDRLPHVQPSFMSSTTIEEDSDYDDENRGSSFLANARPTPPASKRTNLFASRASRPTLLRHDEESDTEYDPVATGADVQQSEGSDDVDVTPGLPGPRHKPGIGAPKSGNMIAVEEQESEEDVVLVGDEEEIDEAEANKENIRPVGLAAPTKWMENVVSGGRGGGTGVGIVLANKDLDEQIKELLCNLGKVMALRVQGKDAILHEAQQQAITQHRASVLKVAHKQLDKKRSYYNAFHHSHLKAQQETRRHLNQLKDSSSKLNSISGLMDSVLGDTVSVAGVVGDFAIRRHVEKENND
ncbi:hypothetical protein BC938DRAFT_478083, partial [Jimgerdemannia flammicorona]